MTSRNSGVRLSTASPIRESTRCKKAIGHNGMGGVANIYRIYYVPIITSIRQFGHICIVALNSHCANVTPLIVQHPAYPRHIQAILPQRTKPAGQSQQADKDWLHDVLLSE